MIQLGLRRLLGVRCPWAFAVLGLDVVRFLV
jgi:hypothetical protein